MFARDRERDSEMEGFLQLERVIGARLLERGRAKSSDLSISCSELPNIGSTCEYTTLVNFPPLSMSKA